MTDEVNEHANDFYGPQRPDEFSYKIIDRNMQNDSIDLCTLLENIVVKCDVFSEKGNSLYFLFDYAVMKKTHGYDRSYIVLAPSCNSQTLAYHKWIAYHGHEIEQALFQYSSYIRSKYDIKLNVVIADGRDSIIMD